MYMVVHKLSKEEYVVPCNFCYVEYKNVITITEEIVIASNKYIKFRPRYIYRCKSCLKECILLGPTEKRIETVL